MWFVPKVSVLIFYLNVYWTHLKLQVISFKVWPLGNYTVVPAFFPLIIAVLEVIFRVCLAHRLQYFVCFPSCRNDDPSTSISTSGRGRNRTELDLGCREDVEVREWFSSPEILEFKAQSELARYRVTAPSRLQCPFGPAGPVFEVVPRHLCRRRD